MPSCGMSRSRKVCRNWRRQATESPSLLAVYASGNPPRNQSRPWARRAQVPQAKAFQVHGFQASCQGFRGLAEQIGRGAAQNQEPSRERLAIRQDAQQRKQFRAALDFIDDHESFERAQRGVGFGQPGHALRVFEVEVIDGIRRNELPGQRRLAALTRPQQRHHAAPPQGSAHQADIGLPIDHGLH